MAIETMLLFFTNPLLWGILVVVGAVTLLVKARPRNPEVTEHDKLMRDAGLTQPSVSVTNSDASTYETARVINGDATLTTITRVDEVFLDDDGVIQITSGDRNTVISLGEYDLFIAEGKPERFDNTDNHCRARFWANGKLIHEVELYGKEVPTFDGSEILGWMKDGADVLIYVGSGVTVLIEEL